MKKILVLILSLLMVFTLAACGGEEEETVNWPEEGKTIEIVCPYGTGGDTDALARQIAVGMEKNLGISVMVTNMKGGSGAVGAEYVLDSDADGYTAFFCHQSLVLNKAFGTTDYDHTASTPAALTAQSTAMVLVSKKFKTVDEVIAYAKANPGQLQFGMCAGGITEVMAYAFCDAVGIEANFVDCGDGTTENNEVVGGRLDVAVNTYGTVKSYVEGKEFEVISVLGSERIDACADVATMQELGYDVDGNMYYGLWLPGDVDSKVAEAFIAAVKAASEETDYINLTKSYAYNPVCIAGADAKKIMDDQLAYYESLL